MTAHSEIAHSTPDSPLSAADELDAARFAAEHGVPFAAAAAAVRAYRQEQEARLAAVTADGPRFTAFAGLDLSLTGTGLAVRPAYAEGLPVTLEKLSSDPADYRSARDTKDRPVATYADRLNRLEDMVAGIEAEIPPAALVFLEAPSYGSAGSGTFDRSGLWWMVYQRLTALSCRVVPVSPAQRCQYAAGKGSAPKDLVLTSVVRRYTDLDVRDNNVADAVVLMAMAARAAGSPLEASLPEANLKAMAKLEAI